MRNFLALLLWMALPMAAQADGFWAGLCQNVFGRAPQATPYSGEQIRSKLSGINLHWRQEFLSRQWAFEDMKLVLYSGRTTSACGLMERRSGPLYCPGDQTLYLDPQFFQDAADFLGEPNEALLTYVLAHETGHHVQTLRHVYATAEAYGLLHWGKRVYKEILPRSEYQADCLAGLYLKALAARGGLNRTVLDEIGSRVERIGDDTQAEIAASKGLAFVSEQAHGTSERRREWLTRGLTSESLEACEPFGFKTLE